MMDSKHKNDHTIFAVPAVVLLHLESGELHLIDKVSFGFGSPEEGHPIDEEKVKAAGLEILGDL